MTLPTNPNGHFGFKEYLATLGLKTSSGKPKYAWKQIKTETEYRNW